MESSDIDNRIEVIQEYERALFEYTKAEARLDAVKKTLKEMGTFSEGGYLVDVSVVTRKTVSLKDIEKSAPAAYELIKSKGLIKESQSERLSVKLKEVPNESQRLV